MTHPLGAAQAGSGFRRVRLTLTITVGAQSDRDAKEWASCVEATLGEQLKEFFGDECSITVGAFGDFVSSEGRG